MDPITIAMLGMGGLSAIQNMSNAKDSKEQRAAAIRYSPWNKIPVNEYKPANPYGDMAQAGAGALGYEQNKEAALKRDQLTDAYIRALDKGNAPAMMSPMTNSQNAGYSPWMAAMNSRSGYNY